jgi:MFS family permease
VPTERQVIRLTSVTHFLTHFFELLLPSVTMFLYRDLKTSIPDLEIRTILEVGTMMYLLYGLLALVWGPIADRFGAKLALGLGMIFAGVGYLIAGMATGIPQLWIAFTFVGIGIAAYHPAGIGLISKTIRERGRALGINGVWGTLGIASAPFIGGIGGFYFGWRTLFVTVGICGLIAGAIMLCVKGREARDDERTAVDALPDGRAVNCFLIICLSMCLSGIVYRGNMLVLPIHFEENLGGIIAWLNQQSWFDVETITGRGGKEKTLGATMLLTGAYLIAIIGQCVAGRIADRHDLRWGYLLFFGMSLPGLLGLAMLSGFPVIIAAGAFVLFGIGMQPIENSLVARLTPARWRSTFFAIKFVLVLGLSFVAVYIVGYTMERWNTAAVYWVLSVLMVGVIAIIGLVIFISRDISMHQRQG